VWLKPITSSFDKHLKESKNVYLMKEKILKQKTIQTRVGKNALKGLGDPVFNKLTNSFKIQGVPLM
jgi:hypothetical protein